MYLEKINAPEDVKKLNIDEMHALAAEMRKALLFRLSKHGGHFGPNFGMVEATIAMHYVFDSPKDQIVYDVSHQSYPHKMLTGRKDAYLYEEHFDDVSGYTNPEESEHDFFNVGHTSTSISLASGLAKARDLNGGTGNVIAVIGDGSLSGGEALEGLDFAGEMDTNFIIVVNDNDMSIAENHGGMYENLKLLRETKGQAECNLFKAMGLSYVYVDQGNDVTALIEAFSQVKDSKTPVVVHIRTLKGKGYAPAEKNKEQWHYSGPFHIETGEPLGTGNEGESYEEITAQYLMDKMKKDPKVLGITSATPTVMGFTADRRKEAGSQFIDVGIAEEHAMTFAAGLAAGGMKPVFAVYSSFLQRAFDQTIHDVCLQNLPVVIAVDRAGLVGSDGETHQGVFDLSFLSLIPNLSILSPKNRWEMADMVRFAVDFQYPIALRYPRGEAYEGLKEFRAPIEYGKSELLYEESEIAVMFVGHMSFLAEQVREDLKAAGYQCSLINARFVKPLDTERIRKISENHRILVTIEENVLTGGFGEQVEDFVMREGIPLKVCTIGISDDYVEHGNVDVLRKEVGLDRESIVKKVIADDQRIKEEK